MEDVKINVCCLIENKDTNEILIQELPTRRFYIPTLEGIEGNVSFVESIINYVRKTTGLEIKNLIQCPVIQKYDIRSFSREITFCYKTSEFEGELKTTTVYRDIHNIINNYWANAEKLTELEVPGIFFDRLKIMESNYLEAFYSDNEKPHGENHTLRLI